MSLPPTNIPASQLWLALCSKERPSQIVDFPRTLPNGDPVGQLRIRVLTQEEQMAATTAAERVAREHLKEAKRDDLGYERLYSDAYCIETLFRACRDVDDVTRPAFPAPKQIRQTMTTEECGALFQHYLTVQLELGPTVWKMSDEEYEAWISRLAEGGSAFLFDTLSSDLQKMLLLYMAYQLRSSPTDNTSAGSQPEETTSNDNSDSSE